MVRTRKAEVTVRTGSAAGRGVRLWGSLALVVGCGGQVTASGYDAGGDAAFLPRTDPSEDASTTRPSDAGTSRGQPVTTADATAARDARPAPDATATPDAGVPLDAIASPDGGAPLDATATPDAAPAHDAHAAPDAVVTDGAHDAPPLFCSPDAASADVPGYVPVVQRLGACSPPVLSAYIEACYSSDSTQSMCDAWYADAADTSCIACLFPTDSAGNATNNGGLLVSEGYYAFSANFPGCFALVDPQNGLACAEVLEPEQQCEYLACGGCATVDSSNSCFADLGADAGACAAYDSAPCRALISDAGVPIGPCATPMAVIDAICGAGP